MAEYITKEQAKLAIKKRLGTMDLFESRFNADIDAIPAAAVQPIVEGASHDGEQDVAPVVRCKDCKRCFKHTTRRYKQTMWLCMRHDFNVNVHPDDFCSYGERKETDGSQV